VLTVINPSTILKESVAFSLQATWTYKETNDGTVALTNPSVADNLCTANGGTITKTSGDTNNNGVLDPGETFVYTCTATFTAPGTYTSVGTAHGIDPLNEDITFCTNPNSPPGGVRCDQDERDSASITVSVTQGKP